VINEELGDDLDLIDIDHLGEAEYSVTSDSNTVITLEEITDEINDRIKQVGKKIKDEKNGFLKKKLEDRLAMLSGSVGIVKVGAGSKVELKEKKDRVEDAIFATKAALKEGIIPGGGSALYWASQKISPANAGEEVLLEAIKSPMTTILDNAGLVDVKCDGKDYCGIDVISGQCVDMLEAGIVDPVLVTKSALKNAVSVVSTIISADCVISNARADESNQ
jgi:chaperonin GroEL